MDKETSARMRTKCTMTTVLGKKETFLGKDSTVLGGETTFSGGDIKKYIKHYTIGGRAYPVRHYPIAIRLRDRKGRAILCSHYFLSVRTLRVLHSECVPSHSFTVVSRLSVGVIGQDIREVKELAILIKCLILK